MRPRRITQASPENPMRRIAPLALLLLAALPAGPAAAQLSVELRGGAGAGSYEATSAGFQTLPRAAFGVSAAYAPVPSLAVYAGYGRTAFGCEEGFCRDADPTFTTSGVSAGLRVQLPVGAWARAGVARHRLDVSSTPGGQPHSGSSEAALGVETGAGWAVSLGRRVSLTPGVGYLRYDAVLADGSSDGVAVVTADVGVRVSF